tara:strand:- start:48742 stop:49230 length:489 start_codon:yes stop_codon:yes gene_type:complete
VTQTSINIRQAEPEDAALILELVRELAVYEKAGHEVLADRQAIHDSLFQDNSTARALIAELDGSAVAYAVYFYNYSTWLGRKGIYLEDVYVKPEFRQRGIGKALLRHVAGIAVQENCGRFEWAVLDWNTPAIEFYETLGAKPQNEWTVYRLSGDDLLRLAES